MEEGSEGRREGENVAVNGVTAAAAAIENVNKS